MAIPWWLPPLRFPVPSLRRNAGSRTELLPLSLPRATVTVHSAAGKLLRRVSARAVSDSPLLSLWRTAPPGVSHHAATAPLPSATARSSSAAPESVRSVPVGPMIPDQPREHYGPVLFAGPGNSSFPLPLRQSALINYAQTFGHGFRAWAVYQRIILRLPYRMITQTMEDLFHETASEASIINF